MILDLGRGFVESDYLYSDVREMLRLGPFGAGDGSFTKPGANDERVPTDMERKFYLSFDGAPT